MKISDYVNRKETNNISDIESCLSKTEKALCQMFTRVEIQGKGDKNVPILLTPKMKESIEILLKLRDAVGVKKSNNYVFASCSYGADYFYRGSASLKKFAMECGASDQESLRSTKLRKQIASLSQVINLKNNELDSLAKFMGHDIRIHRQFYRLLDNIVEIAKISRLLLSLEKGNLHHQIGKGLDDIDVSLEDDAEEEEGIEHQNIEIDEELEECTEETFPESEMAASSHMLVHQSSDRTKGIPTSSTVDNTHQEKLTSPKIPSRRPWTRVEKAAVENHLLDFI